LRLMLRRSLSMRERTNRMWLAVFGSESQKPLNCPGDMA
jgi:hypothetical protein